MSLPQEPAPSWKKASYDQAEVQRLATHGLQGECRLPAPPFMMIDRITSVTANGGDYDRGQVVAEKDVRASEWFFAAHFIGDPVMPGTLGLEALLQLCGFYLAWSGASGQCRALAIGETQFTGMIRPHQKLVRYELSARRLLLKEPPMLIADGRVLIDGEPIYTVKGMKVGAFHLPYPPPPDAS